MRKRNWKQYNRHLVEQGSISFFIDPKIYKTLHQSPRKKKRGPPQLFSDHLIKILLMVKIKYRQAYRALEGFAKSLFKQHPLRIPTYSLICKRAKDLKEELGDLSSKRAQVVVLDASGLRVYGEGEWKVKIHGKGQPRKWVKLHIAIDGETQEIIAEKTTHRFTADSTMVKELLDEVKNSPKVVLADGAYDGKKSREEIRKRGSKPVIPPPRNARYRGTDSERDKAIAEIKGLGGDQIARSIWGKLTGYNKRVLVETAFSRMKRLFGDRMYSQTIERQEVENRLRCMLLNEMRFREG